MNIEVSVYLDLLRFLAGLAVFFGHSYIFTGETWGRPISGFRTDAVAVFFVISGFVIAYVSANREKTLRQYTIARLGRLYSVAIPGIFLTIACDNLGLMVGHEWYTGRWWFNSDTSIIDVIRCLIFSNEFWNAHVVVGSGEPYWSLGYEAPYYALYAAAFFSFGNRFVNLAAVAALSILFGPKILSYLPLWLVGVATFQLVQNDRTWLPHFTARSWLWILAAVPLLFAGLKANAHYNPIWQTNMFEPFKFSVNYFLPVIYYTSIGLLTGISIVAVSNLAGLFARIVHIAGKQIRWLAGGTFTLYLLHQPILLLLVSYFPGNPDSVRRALLIQLATLVVVYCIAELTERRKTFWTSGIEAIFSIAGQVFHGITARLRLL